MNEAVFWVVAPFSLIWTFPKTGREQTTQSSAGVTSPVRRKRVVLGGVMVSVLAIGLEVRGLKPIKCEKI
jgi:hypothetical protein